MKKYILTFALIFTTLLANAQSSSKKRANKDTAKFKYEISCGGVGTQGTAFIKVFSYSKKPVVAKEQAKKNAVHGLIFKGYLGTNQCQSQRPLARNSSLETEKHDYFKSFFAEGGDYMKYVNLTNDGAVGNGDIMKIKKKLYKVGVYVSVNKDELRRRLEQDGIIRGLNSGF